MRSLLFAFIFLPAFCLAQKPVEVAQAQLDAYNEQDIDAFAEVFAENAEVFMNLGDSVPTMVGREVIRERYGKMFKDNPDNKSTLIGRMVQGNFVFDHEYITGRNEPFQLMAIYEVEGGKIVRCWFAR
jgi:hypothetical protein